MEDEQIPFDRWREKYGLRIESIKGILENVARMIQSEADAVMPDGLLPILLETVLAMQAKLDRLPVQLDALGKAEALQAELSEAKEDRIRLLQQHETQLEALRTEVASTKKTSNAKCAELEVELNNVRASLTQETASHKALSDQLDLQNAEYDEEQVLLQNSHKAELNEKTKQLTTLRNKYESEVKALQGQIGIHTTRLNDMESQLSTLRTSHVAELKVQSLEAKESLRTSLEQQRQEASVELLEVQRDLTEASTRVVEVEADNTRLRGQRQQLRDENAELEVRLDGSAAAIAHVRTRLQNLEADLIALRNCLQESEIASTNFEFRQLELQLASSQAQIRLQESILQVRSELALAETREVEANSSRQRLEAMNSELDRHRTDLLSANSELETRLVASNLVTEQLRTLLQDSEGSNTQLHADATATQAAHTHEKIQLRLQLLNEKFAGAEIRSSLRQANIEITRLQSCLHDSGNVNTQLQARMQQSESENTQIRADLQASDSFVEQLSSIETVLSDANMDLQGQLQATQQALDVSEQKLRKKKSKLTSQKRINRLLQEEFIVRCQATRSEIQCLEYKLAGLVNDQSDSFDEVRDADRPDVEESPRQLLVDHSHRAVPVEEMYGQAASAAQPTAGQVDDSIFFFDEYLSPPPAVQPSETAIGKRRRATNSDDSGGEGPSRKVYHTEIVDIDSIIPMSEDHSVGLDAAVHESNVVSSAPTNTTVAGLSITPSVPVQSAEEKAHHIFDMFLIDWDITPEEQERILEQFDCAFSAGRTIDSMIAGIDKHVVGRFDKHPPYPRPCLFGHLVGDTQGPGGSFMTQGSCKHCRKYKRICLWATYMSGVASGYPLRVGHKVENKAWNASVSPRTIMVAGKEVRWVLKRRKRSKDDPDDP